MHDHKYKIYIFLCGEVKIKESEKYSNKLEQCVQNDFKNLNKKVIFELKLTQGAPIEGLKL